MAVVAHVIVRDVTPEQYDAVRAEAGWLTDRPTGALAHLTWWEGNDCHNIDGWESEAAFGAFAETRLGPAMAKVGVTSAPEATFHPAHEVYAPGRTVVGRTADELPGDHVAVLRRGYEAFAAGDVATVLGLFDPDITWYSPDTVQFGGTYLGTDGVGEFFSHLPENYEELRVQPLRMVDSGDTVVVLGQHSGRSRRGAAFDAPFAHVWTFRNGRPVSFSEHLDSAKLNAALNAEAAVPAQA